jgi:hypothetical protein
MNQRSKSIDAAIHFIREVELPPAARLPREGTSLPQAVFDQIKTQATVVGSDIISFVVGVPAESRHDIVNCSLLAQLAANKRVPKRENLRAWYESYFETLTHLGWVIQEKGFAQHRETADDFEANQAILSVATVLLGPGTAALAVIQSTLDAMKSMSDGPWMTVFKRESQTARAARFQITLVEPTPQDGSMVTLMAFELEATATLTQVLFFKFRSSDVMLRHASGRVTINTEVLAAVRPAIAEKIAAYTGNYVAALTI